MALISCFIVGKANALTVVATTSDNGHAAHLVSWTDASGNPRSAMMVDQISTGNGPYTGYMRQYTYLANGVPRTCTGRTSDGGLEESGDGFVQNHGASNADDSTGNGQGFPGTTTISTSSGTLSHVTITYSIPGYTVQDVNNNSQTVPTTVQWFFADGRNDPIFSITQDASGTSGNIGLDSRSPYGDMAYDGDSSGDQLVGGDAWGDTYLFKTFDQANPTYANTLTPQSAWDDTTPNSIPFAMSWAEPDTCNAEMGHVATLPISVLDQGQDNEDGTSGDDPRGHLSSSGLPPATAWAFQINSYSFGGEVTKNDTYTFNTDDKHITWGANFGKVGGYNNGAGLSTTAYSEHYNDPIGDYLQGSRVNSLVMSYSVFVVLGLHGTTANQYNPSGAVGTVVTQMQNVTAATLTASTGSAVTSGPEGVAGAALTTDVTYSPTGYNPIYSTWEITASGNAVNATLTPATGKALVNPVFLIDNYTSSQLPSSISINGQATAGTNYYATLDTANQRLWITANSTASAAMTLVVTPQVTSNQSTATGTNALLDNTTGTGNTADGYEALEKNTTGYGNVGSGSFALLNNTSGYYDSANGAYALYFNTTGADNTANGYAALFENTTGHDNAANGSYALCYDTTGYYNAANGSYALCFDTTGTDNTASGFAALLENTTGHDNTANGTYALCYGTTGAFNAANGAYALCYNTTGTENTANGFAALLENTTGASNTAEGMDALENNTTGSNNISVGDEAGSALTTGNNNIDIGSAGASAEANTIRLGTQGTQTAAYVAGIFGATATSGAPVYVTSTGHLGTLTSSAKFKRNIQDMGDASDALLALRPVTFQYKPEIDPAGTPQFGLIAEEVEKVNPDLVIHDANHQIYTVRYEAVNAMLLNEFQKQHQTIAEQQATIAKQQRALAAQKALLEKLAARLDAVEEAELKDK